MRETDRYMNFGVREFGDGDQQRMQLHRGYRPFTGTF